MKEEQQNQGDKSKLGHKLGLIFGVMVFIILVLNFSSFKTLNSTQDNLNSITRSFEYLALLKQLESHINRE
ncbi:MAG: hypothetical protein F3745_07950, partial [Nitrospinae bacterium]|nr:hypothetical protein [Nitrospinota bacterium]